MKRLTVLMTTYNEESSILRQAIDSILNQSFKDFDFLIIMDNPNNKEIIDILNEYKSKDNRIKVVINEENLGLPLSLNKGINMIDTEYLARMDGDDISKTDRLKKEIEYLDNHKDVGLVCTNLTYIDYEGNILYDRASIPTKPDQIKKIIKYMNILQHPIFMGKTEVFKKYQYKNLNYIEDYDFECRILEDGIKVANINEYLFLYRRPKSIDKIKRTHQRIATCCIQEAYSKHILNKVDISNLINNKITNTNIDKLYDELLRLDKCMNKIRQVGITKTFKDLLSLYIHGTDIIRKEIYNLFMYFVYKKIYKF